MSNSLTCGSFSASSPSFSPSRTTSDSFQTPTSRLPFSRKPIPPNIFLSSTFFRRASRCRMRPARVSSNAIVLLLHQRGPVVLVEHPREAHGVHAVDQGVGPVFLLVGP